jgi:phosphohistidine phosphatase
MQQLTLLRHGDALPSARGSRDFDRPLSDKGLLEVRGAAQAIAAVMPRPDLILASSARRTTETAELVRATVYPDATLLTDAALYCATADALFEVLRGLGDGFASVLLVGHNPGISEACSRLAGDGRLHALPTAGWRRYDAAYLARGSFSPMPG